MATIELDLPLEDTPASRFLVWIMAGLTYLAVLAFAVATVADATIKSFGMQPRIVTVALPAADDPARNEIEMRQVLELLKRTEGVAYTALVSEEELGKLVEPWLGKTKDRGEMPLPRLIDVTFNPGVTPDMTRIDAQVQQLVPGASLGETGAVGVGFERLAETFRLLGGGTGIAILIATALVVVVVTRMSLDLHDETVDLLRLMGAPDSYVARQFEQHALASGLRGGLIGFAFGLFTVVGFIYLPRLGIGTLVLPVDPRPYDWVLLAMVPIVAAILVTGAARFTAVRGLARLR